MLSFAFKKSLRLAFSSAIFLFHFASSQSGQTAEVEMNGAWLEATKTVILQTSSPSVITPPPPSVPQKKYSEVSSASHVVRSSITPSKPVVEEVKTAKKPEVKVGPAVNTQPVADKRMCIAHSV